jgi:DNA-binding transcriptional regulator GbsR (MarR family)
MENNLDLKKKELVERLGVHFEETDHFAPLAARIIAYIILSGKKGSTFDELVTNLCASKSTISTHLTNLQSLKRVGYYTKTGDRKKYYVVNRDRIIKNIDEMIAKWSTQKELHQEIKAYKKEMNNYAKTADNPNFGLEFHNDYITFLDEATKSILELRKKLIEKLKQEIN